MRYEILGPMRASGHGVDVPLGGPKQRLVLALLIEGNENPVSTDRIMDALWPDALPDSARKTLQVYVHYLRKNVGATITTHNGSYALTTGGNVDVAEFERMARGGGADLATQPAVAAEVLRAALALWRGSPYADLQYEMALQPEVRRLEELRLSTVADRIDAELSLGRHLQLISELASLVEEYPLRERLRAQHMTALYRSGRQVEALRSYQKARTTMVEMAGIEPSPQLAQLEERILGNDPSLLAVPRPPERYTSVPSVINNYEIRELVGEGPGWKLFRAYQRSVGRLVALRIFDSPVADSPEFIAHFFEDTQRVAALDHPHIGFVFDAWREPGAAYQVSSWIGGGGLDERLAAHGPMSLAATIDTLNTVTDALSHAHAEGVTHGALSANAIRFDETGQAHLIDFAVGIDRPATPAHDIRDLAGLAIEMLAGKGAQDSATLDVGPDVASLLAQTVAGEFAGTGVADFMRALRRAAGVDVVATAVQPVQPVLRNPYKGLRAFVESDATDFFGREAEADRIVTALRHKRLVAVVGPSGSGKSSLVKAGVLPRLRDGDNRTLISAMYPGAYPFEELERALLRVAVDAASLIEDLVSDGRGLTRVLHRVLPGEDTELILMIDQFEELFSLVGDEPTRRLFIDALVAAVTDPRSRLRVFLTLRADFFDRPLQYPALGALVDDGLVPVTIPDRDNLTAAITEPAAAAGIFFEPGLVDQILADVAGRPGSLPLLQYALTLLVDEATSATLTASQYHACGGVSGAVATQARQLYDHLDGPGREAIHQAMLMMVQVDQSSDHVRRRVRRADLKPRSGDDRAMDRALQKFGAHRLLTFDTEPTTRAPTVEVAHEALFREWGQLRDWIDDHRDALLIRRRIDESMAEWQAAGRDPSFLLTGGPLHQAVGWLEAPETTATEDEAQFIGESREAARNEERRRRSARRRVIAGLSAAVVLLAALSAMAFVQWGRAGTAATRAQVQRLATDSSAALDQDPDLALLLAVEAYDMSQSLATTPPEVLVALHQASQRSRVVMNLDHGSGAGAISADGTTLALGAADDETQLVLVDAATRQELRRISTDRNIGEVYFSPDGRLLAVAHWNNSLGRLGRLDGEPPFGRVVDVASGETVAVLRGECCYGKMDFNPSMSAVAATSENSDSENPDSSAVRIHVWDVAALDGPPMTIDGSALLGWLDDDTLLGYQSREGAIVQLDATDGNELARIAAPANLPSHAITFNALRREIAWDDSGEIERWSLQPAQLVDTFLSPVIVNTAGVQYSGSGDQLFVSGLDDEVLVVDLDTGEAISLRGHAGAVFSVSGDASGRLLLAAPATDGATLWDLSRGGPAPLGNIAAEGGIWQMEFTPDGSKMLVSEESPRGSQARSFDLSSGLPIAESRTYRSGGDAQPAAHAAIVAGRDEEGGVVVEDFTGGDDRYHDPECGVPVSLDDAGRVLLIGNAPVRVRTSCPEGTQARLVDIVSREVLHTFPKGVMVSFADAGPAGTAAEDLFVIQVVEPDRRQSMSFFHIPRREFVAELDFTGQRAWRPFFSADGEYVSFGSEPGAGYAIDVGAALAGASAAESTVLRTFVEGGPTSFSLVGGGYLATGHSGQVVRLWDLESGEQWLSFEVETGNSTFMAFSPDGRSLYYEDRGGVIRRFPLDEKELAALARARVQRDFSPEECSRYGIGRCESAS